MTQRFSEEYIKFVTQSEAIQAAWQKRGVRVGDWVWVKTSLLKVEGLGWIETVYGKGTGTSVWMLPDKRSVMAPILDLLWLPALSDSLDGLEAEGYEPCLSSELNEDTEEMEYRVYCAFRAGEEIDTDRELAAARLLGRVLEKENKSNAL